LRKIKGGDGEGGGKESRRKAVMERSKGEGDEQIINTPGIKQKRGRNDVTEGWERQKKNEWMIGGKEGNESL